MNTEARPRNTFRVRVLSAALSAVLLITPAASAQLVVRSSSGAADTSPTWRSATTMGSVRGETELAQRYDPTLLPPSRRTTVRRVVYDAPADAWEPADLPPRLNSPPAGASEQGVVTRSEIVAPPCRSYSSYAPGSVVTPPSISAPAPSALVAPPNNAYRPVVPLAPEPSRYYVGRGLIGQPKLYVPGQPVRNFFRYVLP